MRRGPSKVRQRPTGQCQRCTRPGVTRMNSQLKRTLILCDQCFGSLFAYELRDLFRTVGKPTNRDA